MMTRVPRRLRGPRPKPPIGQGNTLAAAYSEMIEGWASLLDRLLSGWMHHVMPPYKADATSWIRERIRALEAEIGTSTNALDPILIKVGKRVESKVPQIKIEGTISVKARISARQAPGLAIDAYRATNVAKIKSIASERLQEMTDLLEQAEEENWHVDKLRKEFQRQFDVTKSKASLLARDQTLKLGAAITKERQTQAGIRQYVWSTSGDERVREGHAELDGTVQSWDDPPDTGDGQNCHPGED